MNVNIIWLIVTVIQLGISSYLFYTLWMKDKMFNKQDEEKTKLIVDMALLFRDSYNIMKDLDINQAFEKDDEVGEVFSQMKEALDNINTFFVENVIFIEEEEETNNNNNNNE